MNTVGRNTILAAAASLLLSLPTAHAAEGLEAALQYLPTSNHPMILATINVRKVVDAPLVEKVANAVLDENATRTLPNLAKIAGLDLKKDFERLTLFGAFKPGQKRPELALAVFQGQIDPERIYALLRMNPEYEISKINDVEVHTWTDKGDKQRKYATFVDKGLLVIAVDKASMEASLETAGDKSKSLASTPEGESIAKTAAGPVFWARVIIPPDTPELGDPFGLNRIKDIQLSVDVDETNLKLQVMARSDNTEFRNDFADILRGGLALLRIQHGNKDVSNLARGANVTVDNDTVRLDLAVSSDKLIELIKSGNKQKKKG